jgi:branched-subunit amino acid aminotransferase/4-amino-4-deoxychorismate lyase
VRLLLDHRGEPRVERSPLQPTSLPMRVALAREPVDSSDPFLRHKTTSRARYERHRSAAHDETLLWNERHEITEAITANVVVERDGRRITPPVACGLLPGTMRAELLERGEIEEALVTVGTLITAPRFWLVNSVRGWMDALLDPLDRRPA